MDKIDPNLLKTLSKIAKKENKTETRVLEDMIKKGIETSQKETLEEKIKKFSDTSEKIIIQKPRKSGKSLSTKEIIGLFEAKESFDSVKEIKKMERG